MLNNVYDSLIFNYLDIIIIPVVMDLKLGEAYCKIITVMTASPICEYLLQ
jgi:hypothetical protein